MALIINNKKTLKDTTLIFIKAYKGKTIIEKKEDLIIIKSEKGEPIGYNLLNSSKYKFLKEGIYTPDKSTKIKLEKFGIEFTNDIFFQVGKILKIEKHPKSEKLFILKIITDKEISVVTNVKSLKPGLKVVVANIGAVLPSGVSILENKVMGVNSEGMICGSKTLLLKEASTFYEPKGLPGEEYFINKV